MITIYGELYSSKNSRNVVRINGRNIPLKSKKAKAQEADLHYQLLANKKKFIQMYAKTSYPINIQFKIYRRTHRKFDYINIVQGLLDAMVRAGLIPDDDSKHIIPSFLPYEKDEKNPRTEITLNSQKMIKIIAGDLRND